MSFWYLATPYAHPSDLVREARAEAAGRIVAHYLLRGLPVFSPIAHGHAFHPHLSSWGHNDWLEYDRHFLEVSCGLMVAELPGWVESKGMAWEIEWAEQHKHPVVHLVEGLLASFLPSRLLEGCAKPECD